MSETPQPNPNQQIDPFFNPEIAKTWALPNSQDKIEKFSAPIVQETLSNDPYWLKLHEARQNTTEARAHNRVYAALNALSTEPSRVDLVPAESFREYFNFGLSTGVSAESLLEMRDLGVLDTFLQHNNEAFTLDVSGGVLSIDRSFGQGPFEIKFSSKDQIYAIESDVKQARGKNEMLQVTEQLVARKSNDANGDILETPISIEDDPLTFSMILSSLGLSVEGYNLDISNIQSTTELQALYIDKINFAFNRGSYSIREITDTQDPSKITGYTWDLQGEPGCSIFMITQEPFTKGQDLSTIKWQMGWSIDKAEVYHEQANNSPGTTSEAFLTRPTGIALIESLSKNGLKFNRDIEQFAIYESSYANMDRFGGVYTEISRELAKCINDGNLNRFYDIFDVNEGDDSTELLIEKLKNFSAESSENAAVALLQHTIKQIIHRNESDNFESNIPVSNERVEIKDGACFDVAGYYAGASSIPNGLTRITFGETMFLHKNHGAKTFLNLDPVMVKGVEIPKGSLFIQAKDGGLVFQRFTPYNFDAHEDMVNAFGTEVIKAEQNNQTSLTTIAKKIMV